MNIVALVHRRTRWHDSCLLLFLPFVLLLVGCSGSTATTNRAACPAVAELVGDQPLMLLSSTSSSPCIQGCRVASRWSIMQRAVGREPVDCSINSSILEPRMLP
jgi:hypothetical protein